MKKPRADYKQLIRRLQAIFKWLEKAHKEKTLRQYNGNNVDLLYLRIEIAVQLYKFRKNQQDTLIFYLNQLDQVAELIGSLRNVR